MSVDWVALQSFLLLATAVAVAYYAHTAREQLEATKDLIETAQRQVEAAQRQLEASHTPCVVPIVAPDPAAAAHVQLHNVGNGPALNLRYLQTPQADFAWPPGLVNATPCPPIAAGALHAIEETRLGLKSPHFFRIQYESSSGHRYQTEATILGQADTVDVRLRRL
jgi:hypothetical protein